MKCVEHERSDEKNKQSKNVRTMKKMNSKGTENCDKTNNLICQSKRQTKILI